MFRKPPRRADEPTATIHLLPINACCQVGNAHLSFREVGIELPTCSFDVQGPGKPGIPLFKKCQRRGGPKTVGAVREKRLVHQAFCQPQLAGFWHPTSSLVRGGGIKLPPKLERWQSPGKPGNGETGDLAMHAHYDPNWISDTNNIYLHYDNDYSDMKRLTILLLFILPFLFSCTQKELEVRVQSVSVSPTSKELTIGETIQLSATISPSDATNKQVIWSSSKASVASVSSSGFVTALSEGTATITDTADGKKADCTVAVVKAAVAVTEIKLDKTELTLYEGAEESLTVTLLPEEAKTNTITWSSSNTSIATVESGKVKAIGKGTAKITASAGGKSVSCSVEVLRPVSGIKLDKTSLEMYLEKSETLTASIVPEDATPREEIKWSSSNTDVAIVDGGKVTAVSMGNAVIMASLEGFKAECTVTVKGVEYAAVAITDLKPVEILPVIGQVTVGDKDVYNHIEHLRLAEATRIRDMMWEYGAGQHSKEAYQQLMGRLVIGMASECPPLTEEFDVVGRAFSDLTGESNHASIEWSILNLIVPNTRRIITINAFYDKDYAGLSESSSQGDWINMDAFMEAYPSSFLIMAQSTGSYTYDSYSDASEYERIREYCRSGKLIYFKSGGNIHEHYGVLINKCFHKDVNKDEHGMYVGLESSANGKNDASADMALLITVGTNASGDVDQTGENTASSVFPVGFHDKVLFAGRAFPAYELKGGYYSAEGSVNNGKYATSYTNYVNTALMGVCFQMHSDVKDSFELLDMVRSTCLTDYIRLDGQTQPLQLINPAGLYKKYLTPQNLPTAISVGETLSLDKGYYKGVLFSIPGAEVKVNGEWVAFDNKNKDAIFSQNPMTLEWRLNGDLLKKYGYTSGQTVEGQVITVDDKWGGLRLEVPMSVQLR